MPDDLWSRGKCGLKVLQYQAAGLPVLANPVGVHPEMVRPGLDGFLPDTADDWVAAVRALALDPGARLRMGRAARASLERNYSVERWAPAFVAAIAGSGSGSGSGDPAADPASRARSPAQPARRGGEVSSAGPRQRT